MQSEEIEVRSKEIETYLDHVDRLLLDDPKSALVAATPLPLLVEKLLPDTRARAHTCLALAQLKTGDLAAARRAFELAEKASREGSPTIRALVILRTSSLLVRELRYREAEAELEKALELAGRRPSGPLLGRIHLSRGSVAFLQGAFREASDGYSRALDALPRGHYLRRTAAWNLIVTLYHLDGRDACALLAHMKDLGLRCRRPRSKSIRRSVSGCMVCWAEGYIHGLLGFHRHAARCLIWASHALAELGALREATLCTLDLFSIDPDALPKVSQILEAFAADPDTPTVVVDAARRWATWPGTDYPELVRRHVLRNRRAIAGND